MKTQIYRTIAIAAMSVLVFNILAQNTRSVRMRTTPEYQLLASIERNSSPTVSVTDELKIQLEALEENVKFLPADVLTYPEPLKMEALLEEVTFELEKDAKFNVNESVTNVYEALIVANEICSALEADVKFNPAQSAVMNEYEVEQNFAGILSELSKSAKYQPTIMP